MAATVTLLATNGDDNPGLTCVSGATVTAAVDDWLVAIVACSNDGHNGISPFSALSDSGSNTWTTRAHATYDPGAAGDGCTIVVGTAIVTNALTSGTVTATFSVETDQSAIQVYRVRPGTGETVSFVTSGTAGGSNATAHKTSTISVTSGDIMFGVASVETDESLTGDSDTSNGSWSAVVNTTADAGTDDDSITCVSQYKITTGTGNQQWEGTSATARDSRTAHVVLRSSVQPDSIEADPGSYAITGTAASLEHGWVVAAAAGSYAVTGTNATLNYGLTLDTGAAGTYAVTGTNAALYHGWEIVPAAGSYAVTGTNATLTLTTDKRIEAAAGSYAITGRTVQLQLFTEAEVASGGMPLKFYAPRVHNYVEVTPAVQAAAYSANDVVFTATEVPNATWRTTPGGEEMILESIAILDEDDNAAAAWTFYLGRSSFTIGAINGAVNISDADAALITSAYTMADTAFIDLINSKLGYAGKLGLSVMPASGSKSVYIAASTAGTPTFSATTSIKLKLHFIS
jgi:hypothetical protein